MKKDYSWNEKRLFVKLQAEKPSLEVIYNWDVTALLLILWNGKFQVIIFIPFIQMEILVCVK